MCGISGLIGSTPTSADKLHNTLSNITECIAHRGPDAQQIWCEPDLPLALGHRRLAIIDLTDDGLQPMHSHDGRYVMVFNGEFYNFKEIKKELAPHKLTFKGNSDTEVILNAISIWGLENTLNKIRGMFAIALWDRTEKMLHLIRDRLGKKPLYIGWAGDNLVFASELKAIYAHPEFEPEVNPQTQATFIKYGYIPSPHTIYKKVWQLPPGHRTSLSYHQISTNIDIPSTFTPYWSAADIAQEQYHQAADKDENTIIAKFTALLTDCVNERMVSDVPLGAFLSGGLDSSAIVALMQSISEQPIKTYTIGFEQEGYNEAEHAKAIAAHLGTDHHEHYLNGKEALDVIPMLPQMYDEPFADISAIPTYLVSKFARKDVTVALSGDGGDEMLGGYQRYLSAPQIWNKAKHFPAPLRYITSYLIKTIPPHRWSELRPSHPQFGERLHKAAKILNQNNEIACYESILSQTDHVKKWFQDIHTFPITQLHDHNIEGASFAENMMLNDAIFYLPYDILTKVDRATMAVSLEGRAPLLDSRIFEYVWTLPKTYKIRNGQGKWLLRQVLEQHVPKELFERPKQGFSIPVGEWLRTDLRDWAESLLNTAALEQNGLNALQIQNIWRRHCQGQGGDATFLWTILTYQAWSQKWIHNAKTANCPSRSARATA